jgi:hypothetical protein
MDASVENAQFFCQISHFCIAYCAVLCYNIYDGGAQNETQYR